LAKRRATRCSAYSGEVRSRFETPLAFRIAGKITARLVDSGALVKAGEVLARLDAGDTALSLASASAQLELADADLRRFRNLRERNFVSQAALEAKETGFKAAQAQADLARNQSAYTVLRPIRPASSVRWQPKSGRSWRPDRP
jgi:multidrug efflux system membrane fusion protein